MIVAILRLLSLLIVALHAFLFQTLQQMVGTYSTILITGALMILVFLALLVAADIRRMENRRE